MGRRLMHLTSTVLVVALLAIIGTIAWVLVTSVDQASETRVKTGGIALVGEIAAEFHQEVAVADQLVSEMLLERPASAPFRSSTTGDTIGAVEEGEPLPISHHSLADHGIEPAAALFRTNPSQLEPLVGEETSQLSEVVKATRRARKLPETPARRKWS